MVDVHGDDVGGPPDRRPVRAAHVPVGNLRAVALSSRTTSAFDSFARHCARTARMNRTRRVAHQATMGEATRTAQTDTAYPLLPEE